MKKYVFLLLIFSVSMLSFAENGPDKLAISDSSMSQSNLHNESILSRASSPSLSKSPVNPSVNIMQMLLGLLAIIAMIFAILWLMKHLGYRQMHGNHIMSIKACLALSPKEKLVLIELGSEQILLGVAPGCITKLKTLDNPIGQDEQEAYISSAFANKLKTFIYKDPISDEVIK